MQDEPDVAAAMGFSSFGGQNRPQKKRKHNQQDEGGLSGQQPDRTASRPTVSGEGGSSMLNVSSNTALNVDAIALDDDSLSEDDLKGSDHLLPRGPPKADTTAPASSQARPAGLPQRPVNSVAPVMRPSSDGPKHHRDRGGQPLHQDYYDSKSNENPWQRLEEKHGLQPLCNGPSTCVSEAQTT